MFHKNDSYFWTDVDGYNHYSPDRRVNAAAVSLLWLEAAMFSYLTIDNLPWPVTALLLGASAQQMFHAVKGHSVTPLHGN
jgi:hypothetical protein